MAAPKGTFRLSFMTKKAEAQAAQDADATGRGTGARTKQIEDRQKRRQEATTVDGSESFPPPGMDLPDGGQVPLDPEESAA